MTKDEIYSRIQSNNDAIDSKVSQLNSEKEKLDILVVTLDRAKSKEIEFQNYISSKKNRLTGLDMLLASVNIANIFKNKSMDSLTGQEYRKAVSSINDMKYRINQEINSQRSKIDTLEREISDLRRTTDRLWYDYNNYQEENINA